MTRLLKVKHIASGEKEALLKMNRFLNTVVLLIQEIDRLAYLSPLKRAGIQYICQWIVRTQQRFILPLEGERYKRRRLNDTVNKYMEDKEGDKSKSNSKRFD